MALSNENAQLVELLINYGAKVEVATSSKNRTLLQEASVKNNVDAATLLLKGGADVNKSNEVGVTSLHIASSLSHTLLVKLLLQYGADVNKVDIVGQTPLDWAYNRSHYEAVCIFLTAGANPNLKNESDPHDNYTVSYYYIYTYI